MMELMITLGIMAVLAALAVPSYFRTVEVARANEAKTNLNIIHMAQKIYRINYATYWIPGVTNIAAANTALSVDMSAVYYTTVNIAGTANNYTAVLTRNAVEGGRSSKWFQYAFTNGQAAPVVTEGGAY